MEQIPPPKDLPLGPEPNIQERLDAANSWPHCGDYTELIPAQDLAERWSVAPRLQRATPAHQGRRLLQHLQACGVREAIQRFIYVQMTAAEEHGSDLSDWVLLPSRVDPEWRAMGLPAWHSLIEPFPRAITRIASAPLELLDLTFARAPNQTAAWVLWYEDESCWRFPVVLARSGHLLGGWVIEQPGTWWPIASPDLGLPSLFAGDRLELCSESRAVQELLSARAVKANKFTGKVDNADEAFQWVLRVAIDLQVAALRGFFALALDRGHRDFGTFTPGGARPGR